jgi:hypothetical protein
MNFFCLVTEFSVNLFWPFGLLESQIDYFKIKIGNGNPSLEAERNLMESMDNNTGPNPGSNTEGTSGYFCYNCSKTFQVSNGNDFNYQCNQNFSNNLRQQIFAGH